MSMSKHLFLAASVLATLLVSATSSNFASYMLSQQWPPSFCSVNDCKKPISNTFVIHGFWPQYANGNGVPPYNKDTNNCNDNPTDPSGIVLLLGDIITDLKTYWPSLYKNGDNYRFWRDEWASHGMCSDYPQDPKAYFKAGLDLAKTYNPLTVIGVIPGGKTKLEDAIAKVEEKLKVKPQILCQTDSAKRNLLLELRLCFARAKPPSLPSSLVDCPITSSNCPTGADLILPEAPRGVAELDIIEEVVSM